MAAGSLVVAHTSTAGGNPELIDGKTCLLARDAAAFAEKMRRAVEDKAGAAAIAASALAAYRGIYAPDEAAPRLGEALVETLRAQQEMTHHP
jgi:hypothetical protein